MTSVNIICIIIIKMIISAWCIDVNKKENNKKNIEIQNIINEVIALVKRSKSNELRNNKM